MNKGKLVFCISTHQIFPSAKVAAKECNESYHMVYKKLEGKVTGKGNRYVYCESMADLKNIFAYEFKKQRINEKAIKMQAEIEALEKQQQELAKQLEIAKEKLLKLS